MVWTQLQSISKYVEWKNIRGDHTLISEQLNAIAQNCLTAHIVANVVTFDLVNHALL